MIVLILAELRQKSMPLSNQVCSRVALARVRRVLIKRGLKPRDYYLFRQPNEFFSLQCKSLAQRDRETLVVEDAPSAVVACL
jgi:hypothetical protein